MSILTTVTNMTGRVGLKVKAASPELLIGAGIVGVVGSAVMASKATLKVEGVLDEAKDQLGKVNAVIEDTELAKKNGYTIKDARKDKGLVIYQTSLKLAKLYGPSIIVGGLSIAALIGSHKILKGRNVALMSAYKALDTGYKKYRGRVVDKLGEKADREFRFGATEEVQKVKTLNDKGKEVEEQVTNIDVDPSEISIYAKFFDAASMHWQKDAEYNLMFLKAQQNYANDLLKARGHVFLNEVYDMLDIPRTKEGAIVGWVDGSDGDSYVDFDIYNYDKEAKRSFVNGEESVALLDFNVDGVIYDQI